MKGQMFQKIRPCRHPSTIAVTTSGLERRVCEACGNVTVKYEFSISGDARRENFARVSEAPRRLETAELADQEPGQPNAPSGAHYDWPFLTE